MIFEILNESAERGELILVNGGLCHYHIRRDGQLTIREIIVIPEEQGKGIGKSILDSLLKMECSSIFAKCPADLISNGWYERMGFEKEGVSETRSGKVINHWRLEKE